MARKFTSDAEVAVWQTRATSGPYKNSGDASTNSPNDHVRLLSQADALVSSPTGQRWTGNATSTCFPPSGTSDPPFSRLYGLNAAAAGLVFLITGTSSYSDAARDALLDQEGQAGTDFTNTTKWCPSHAQADAHHDVAHWLAKLLFAYDSIRDGLSGANQTTLDAWFLAAGRYFDAVGANGVIDNRFPNRDSDDYVTLAQDPTTNAKVIYFGGPTAVDWHRMWNNRRAAISGVGGLIGLVVGGNTIRNGAITLVDSAKRYFEESIKFNVFPDGNENHISDYERWTTGTPQLGWHYASDATMSHIVFSDCLARTGDLSAFNFSTTDGRRGTDGGTKSLLAMIRTNLKYVDGTLVNHGTANAGLLDGAHEIGPVNRVHDINAARANLFYRDDTVKTQNLRRPSSL